MFNIIKIKDKAIDGAVNMALKTGAVIAGGMIGAGTGTVTGFAVAGPAGAGIGFVTGLSTGMYTGNKISNKQIWK